MDHRSRGVLLIAAACLMLAGCQSQTPSSPGVISPAPEPRPLTITRQEWMFEDKPGEVFITPSYRIYTTSTNPRILDRVAGFAETAMAHYTSAITPLPLPTAPMEVYMFANRPQWARMTQRLLGRSAETYLQVERGGYSADGRAIFWDIGLYDTWIIMGHEGWHQYTQTNFKDYLPTSIEEGIATYMEGFRWSGSDRTTPRFMPWANFERFFRLREVNSSGDLMPLDKLLRSSPQELVSESADAVLDYYAQVWVMTHFFLEGEGGTLRDPFVQMINDAQSGELSRKVGRGRRTDALSAYTGRPTSTLNDAYAAFVKKTVRVGAGELIRRGQSPHANEVAQ